MIGTRKIMFVSALAVALCFVLVSLAGAGSLQNDDRWWLRNNFPNRKTLVKMPKWGVSKPGTQKSVKWVTHAPNPRFAIYDSGTPANLYDDLVLDRETGLVWARNANIFSGNAAWENAVSFCYSQTLGNRKGWRLPMFEELLSLVDPSQYNPALPSGHPFVNVCVDCEFWSRTTTEIDSSEAWVLDMYMGTWTGESKTDHSAIPWPVRGGTGYASGNW